ncbi:MAG: hypothetical protein AAF492_28085, partial [Verrucomicrobiota bacterium]
AEDQLDTPAFALIGPAITDVVLTPANEDADCLPDDWETLHGFDPNDPSDETADPDADGLNNIEEYFRTTDPNSADSDGDGLNDGQEIMAGTEPTDPASTLRLRPLNNTVDNTVLIRWASKPGRRYDLERTTNLYINFSPVATNLPATPPINVYTDVVENTEIMYYRVRLTP